MRSRTRWTLAGLVALPLLVMGADYALWRWAVQRLDEGLARWVASARARGWSITAGPAVRGGWPLAASLEIPDVFLSGGEPDIPGGLTWSAERVVLRLELFHPRQLVIEPSGEEHFRITESPDIPFTADRIRAVMPLAASDPAVGITAGNLRLGQPATTIGAMVVQGSTTRAGLGFSLQASAIRLPAVHPWPLGSQVTKLTLEGLFTGQAPPTPDLAVRAAAWRDAGGSLMLRQLTLAWGRLGLDANGKLTLDKNLQPTGEATARFTGYAQALDELAHNGVTNERTAGAAKAVLSLMSHPAPGTGEAEVEVPLTLQDRTLSLGQIPLARLPEMVWPSD